MSTIPLLPTRFLGRRFACRHRECGCRFSSADLRTVVAHPTRDGRYAAAGVFGLPEPIAVFAPCGHEITSKVPQIIWAEAPVCEVTR